MLTDDVVAQGLDAGKMVREAAQNIQGGGGGQKHFATAGGKQVDGLTKALEALITNF
jgi:alanyl-tRNA synthetase